MNKKQFLYIPFALIFLFSMSVLVIHYSNISRYANFDPSPYKLPFTYFQGGVINLQEDGIKAGLQVGDTITKFGDLSNKEFDALLKGIRKLDSPEPINIQIERNIANGEKIQKTVTVTPSKIKVNAKYLMGLVVNISFAYLLPTFCVLLGLWVVFMRPHDYLAWLLYFLLSGLSVISFEANVTSTLVFFYKIIFNIK